MPTAKGTILVTGANGGLGSAIVKHIVTSPELSSYHSLYTVRSTSHHSSSKLSHTLESDTSKHNYDILTLDIASLTSVRNVAASVNARVAAGEIPPIRALVLSAGFQDFGKQRWTDDSGLDITFASNYLGHWLLTLSLLESMDKQSGRIVIIGSQTHDAQDKRNARTFPPQYRVIIQDENSFEAIAKGTWSSAAQDSSFYSGVRRYAASKLFLVMMIHSLQARLNTDSALNKVSVLGVDPGTMTTGLQRYAPWFIRVVLFRFVFRIIAWLNPTGAIRTPERSAGEVLRAAFDNGPGQGEEPKGIYLFGNQLIETGEESRNRNKRELVWSGSVRLAGLKHGETVLANWQ